MDRESLLGVVAERNCDAAGAPNGDGAGEAAEPNGDDDEATGAPNGAGAGELPKPPNPPGAAPGAGAVPNAPDDAGAPNNPPGTGAGGAVDPNGDDEAVLPKILLPPPMAVALLRAGATNRLKPGSLGD